MIDPAGSLQTVALSQAAHSQFSRSLRPAPSRPRLVRSVAALAASRSRSWPDGRLESGVGAVNVRQRGTVVSAGHFSVGL
jgi:hypothetical protein